MRQRPPPPSLSFQSRLATTSALNGNITPTSPSYSESVPYTPSVYSHRHPSESPLRRPSSESATSDETDMVQISSQLRQAWAEMQGEHHRHHYHHANRIDATLTNDDESLNVLVSGEGEGDESREESHHSGSSQYLDIDEADVPGSRLSVMGPKMKVLSKAPWESDSLEGDDSVDDDDPPLREDGGELKDDLSEVASIFGRNLGHLKKPHERNKLGTPGTKSNGESDQSSSSKGWMGFVSRMPRATPIKDMISAPISFMSTSDPPHTLSPTQASFQRAGTSSPDSGNGNVRRPMQRRTVSNPSHPRTGSLASATSSSISSIPSPRSDRFQNHYPPSPSPNHHLSSSSSSFVQHRLLPTEPLSLPIRTQAPSIADDTLETSEDHGFHPFANPVVYHTASSPRPDPPGGSNAVTQQPPPSLNSNSSTRVSSFAPGSSSGIGSSSLLNPRSESLTTLTGNSSTSTVTLSAVSPFPSPSPSSVAFPTGSSTASPSLRRSNSVLALGSGLSASLSADAAARVSKVPKGRKVDSEVNMAGMQTHAYPGSPAYNLITLEQAQEKIRSRTKSGPASRAAGSTPNFTGVKDTVGCVPLNRKVASQGNLHGALTAAERVPGFSGHIVGESPPLPPLPPSSPLSNPSAPPSGSVAMASSKPLRPKRSGFFKFLSGGDKDKSSGTSSKAEQDSGPPLPEGFVHVAMARSISSFAELGIIAPSPGGSTTSDRAEQHHHHHHAGSEGEIPPIPPVPAQYRRDPYTEMGKADTSSAASASTTSFDSLSPSSSTANMTISSAQRVRIPSAATTSSLPRPPGRSRTDPTPTPSLVTSNASAAANAKSKAESTPKLGWGTLSKKVSRARMIPTTSDPIRQQEASKDALEFPLQLRPMSGLFPSGLPVDLIGEPSVPITNRSSPGVVVVNDGDLAGDMKNDPSIGTESRARRRPFDLGIGIPDNGAHADVGVDLYSPITASSLSSGRSTSVSVSTATTTTGPMTPRSSRSLMNMQQYTAPSWSATPVSTSGPRTHPPNVATPIDPQVQLLQDRLARERKAWQLQRWEFEAQIRDLETRVAELQAASCSECGSALGKPDANLQQRRSETVENPTGTAVVGVPPIKPSIMSRPRPRTGAATAKWVPA